MDGQIHRYQFQTAPGATLGGELRRLAEEVGVPSVLDRPAPPIQATRGDVTRDEFTAALLREAADGLDPR